MNDATLAERTKALAPEGVDHIVEVAFGANIDADVEMLKMGGSIGAYATAGWPGFEIGERIPLAEIARAHESAEHPVRRGRVVLMV